MAHKYMPKIFHYPPPPKKKPLQPPSYILNVRSLKWIKKILKLDDTEIEKCNFH